MVILIYKKMNSKLYCFVLNYALLILSYLIESDADDIRLGDHPYLVLVEINNSSDTTEYVNGCLASLSWVLALSPSLAQLPTGQLKKHSLAVNVFAALVSMDKRNSAPKRSVKRIITDLMESDDENKHFPNMVLLSLKASFKSSVNVRPVTFNVGMLGTETLIVGWAQSSDHAVSYRVTEDTAKRCNRRSLIDHRQQVCVFGLKPAIGAPLLSGALIVDQGVLTGLKQLDTYYKTPSGAIVSLAVRINFYMSWIQFYVLDPVPKKVFLRTNFSDDDIAVDPWYKASVELLNSCSVSIMHLLGVVMASLPKRPAFVIVTCVRARVSQFRGMHCYNIVFYVKLQPKPGEKDDSSGQGDDSSNADRPWAFLLTTAPGILLVSGLLTL